VAIAQQLKATTIQSALTKFIDRNRRGAGQRTSGAGEAPSRCTTET
jgi:hypothetical protein